MSYYPHHPHYPQPYGYPRPYPPAPQPALGPAPWPGHGVSPAGYPPPPPAANEPLFTVRIRKHAGLAILMLNETYTVTGTFAQCEAALREALVHNLALGWWSVASLLVCNWIALFENHRARVTLRRQAAQANASRQPAAWQTPPTAADTRGFRR